MWAHTSRPTSKLAIAAPLVPDMSPLPRAGTPSSLRLSLQPGEEEDEENDPFDPFAPKPMPRSFHSSEHDFAQPWSNSSVSSSSLSTDDAQYGYFTNGNGEYPPQPYGAQSLDDAEQYDPDTNPTLLDGMTPLDVLGSIFGSALAPSELDEALQSNGYDFDRAMSWLVDRQIASGALAATIPTPATMKVQSMGNRVSLISRDGPGFRGGRGGFMPRGQKFPGRPVPGGNRVCRYFLAGECLRADCRFRSVRSAASSCCMVANFVLFGFDCPLVMTLNALSAAFGCAVRAQRARIASSCTICQRTWTCRV